MLSGGRFRARADKQTVFNPGKATSMKCAHEPTTSTDPHRHMSAAERISASKVISDSKRSTPNQKSSLSGLQALFSSNDNQQRRHMEYRPTHDQRDDGPACRIYGSASVKKVTGNLHITTLGHGYMSFQHTDHEGTSAVDVFS